MWSDRLFRIQDFRGGQVAQGAVGRYRKQGGFPHDCDREDSPVDQDRQLQEAAEVFLGGVVLRPRGGPEEDRGTGQSQGGQGNRHSLVLLSSRGQVCRRQGGTT